MLTFLIMGKISGEKAFIGMGVGLAFAYTISMFAEIFTAIMKNILKGGSGKYLKKLIAFIER